MARFTDRQAFEAELIALIPRLRAFGRSLCGDVATGEDLAQETCARALSSRDAFEMGTDMKAWTFTILRNLFYSEKRRAWRCAPLEQERAERTLLAVTSDTDRLELDELRRALAMLPCNQREALVLVGAAGLSYEEVSAIMGTPVGTVKSRVSRARDQLTLLLEEGYIAKDSGALDDAMSAIMQQIAEHRTAA